MLKELRIHHLVLVEKACVAFEEGLHIITGETGSGKSALIEALALVLGQRADTSLLRKGSEKGIVEALFSIDPTSVVYRILEGVGIECCVDEELLIRREILATGKGRVYIQDQPTTLATLRDIGKHLMKFVGQHAAQQLLNEETHRNILDTYAGIERETALMAKLWTKERSLQKEIETLQRSETARLRSQEVCRVEMEEIDKAAIEDGEEEELFAEYTKLCHADELQGYIGSLLGPLTGADDALLGMIKGLRMPFEKILQKDASIKETYEAYKGVVAELEEIAYNLENYRSHLESNPFRSQEVNERLTAINKIKKRFGPTVENVFHYREELEKRLFELENADENIESLQRELEKVRSEVDLIARSVTEGRTVASKALALAVMEQLRMLNMPQALFEVRLQPRERSSVGDEDIEFYMAPNAGERMISIKESASGGELARLMLSFQVLLGSKEAILTLVFDEIDANIGGETALIVGEKLKELSSHHQVLCITHFPQVAIYAHHHLQIAKKNVSGRTLTTIQHLPHEERQKELKRMLGGEVLQGVKYG